MRHFLQSLAFLGLVFTISCSRSAPAPVKDEQVVVQAGEPGKIPAALPVQDQDKNVGSPGSPQQSLPSQSSGVEPADSDNNKYEAALTEGLVHMAEQKWAPALLAFETAQRFNDTEFVRGEIAKLRQRVEQETAAQKTVGDIEKVLEDGKAPEAAKLAQQALKEFGDGDASAQFVKLRLQADALQNAAVKEDAAARAQRYRDEGDAALREQNLRAAALAFEQALLAREDARLQDQLNDLRGRLQNYDGLRRRAAELRRDPQHLEEALAALNDAAKAWDTLQVRQEIDECNLALQKRRDNVSVADFDVRGHLGFADAGRTIAEELLPHFKTRFDLVERGQINKVIAELKLEDSFADDPDDQRELARLARVRYLVVGSVSPLSGVTVSARLVDARSGLVVQTGKVSAPTLELAVGQLPLLAKQLLMSDEEKMAFDAQQARLAKKITPPADDLPLPAPPPAPVVGVVAPPPPVVFEAPAPPPFLGVTFEHFRRLPPPPAVIVQLPPPPLPEPIFRQRMLHASLALGDDHFRHGRYREAQRHFEFALNLSPGNFDLRLRLERVQPLLPPPPRVVVVQPVAAPVVIARPRIAVLDFATFGDPRVVSPGLGPWTAVQLAPYFRARYDVADPAEVYWHMGRIGMTMRDLLEDPNARRWLARAAGVRYFVVGALVETASFNVHAYMLDAEFGHLYSSASLHVRNPFELKLRLGELAQLTMVDPAERARLLAEADRFNALVLRGRQCMDRRDFSIAVGVFEDALRLRPGHVEVMFHLTNSRRQAEIFAIEESRRQQYQRQQAFAAEAARRQWELARAAEAARIRAAQQAALLDAAARRRFEEERLRAHQGLLVQARFAIQTKNFTLALDFFKGAADIVPPQPVVVGFTPQPDIYREIALARAEADNAARLRSAQAVAAREAAVRQQRELELARVRQRLAQEKQALAQAQKKAQGDRDHLLYQASFDEGQRLYAQGKYAAALSAFQAARRVQSTPAVEQLISLTVHQQTLATAKGDAERKQLEAKLAAEHTRRKQAEADAKRNQELYQGALELANKALAQKQYALAESKYNEAGKLFQTDAVLTGLQRVQAGRAAVAQQAQSEAGKSTRIKQLLGDGKAALDAKEFGKAVQAYQQAKNLAPDNLDVLAGLSQAEAARVKFQAAAQRQADDAARQKEFQRLLQSGQANLKAKQYDAAALALNEALKLRPSDAAAATALQEVELGRKSASLSAQAAVAAKKKTAAYQVLMADGRRALEAKRFDDAVKSFAEAQKLLPGDQTSAGFLKDAQAAKSDAAAAVAAAAKKRAEEIQRAAELQKALTQGRTALAAKDYAAAAKAFDVAAQLSPANPEVQRALADMRKAQDLVKADAEARQKRQIQFQSMLAAGKKALEAKNFDGAVATLAQANALVPDDKVGQDLLRQAQKAQADARFAGDVGKLARADKVKQLISASQAAIRQKDFVAADKALADAQKLVPNDPGIAQTQKELSAARQAAAVAAERDNDFRKFMLAGQNAMQAKSYKAAVQAFQQAAKLKPSDPQVTVLLESAQRELRRDPGIGLPKPKEEPKKKDDAKKPTADARDFQELLQAGQKALQAKKYDEAVRAFAEAQQLRPNNEAVAKLLKQAQKLQSDAKKK